MEMSHHGNAKKKKEKKKMFSNSFRKFVVLSVLGNVS